MIYYLCLRPTIGLCGLMPTNPQSKPYIMFLFVQSQICRQLPSDSSSRKTPLLLANDSHWQARSGLPPYRYMVCVAHNEKSFSNEKLLVRIIGLEPTRLAAPDPKSGMSTNFTISACNCGANIHKFFNCKTFF